MAKVIVRAGKIGFVFTLPILILAIVLYAINYSATAQVESEEVLSVSADLFGEAKTFQQSDQIPEAEAVYRRIMTEQAGTSAALDAARERVLMYIEANDGLAAQLAIEDLATGFAPYVGYSKALLDIGDKYRQAGKPDKARAIYANILTTDPQNENAIWCRMGLVISDIALKNDPNAAQGVQQLLQEYSTDPRVANAACLVADAYRKAGHLQDAKALYNYVVTTQPTAEHALWSRMGLVISDLALKNDPNAAQGVQQLLQKHSTDQRIANAACQIADRYQETGDHAMSKALYTYVVSVWPQEEHAIWSQKGLAVVEEKTDPNSADQLDRLLMNFAGHADLPLAAFLVGEGYRDAALERMEEGKFEEAAKGYQKAAGVWERIIQLQPETAYTPEAYYILAECNYMAGQYDQAIYHYQFVAERWPDFKLAWHSQFMVGYRYQQLKQAGLVDEQTANIQTAAAYKTMLSADPNCPASKAATHWLNEYGI